LQNRLKNPSSFWIFGSPVKRFKLQHLLTQQLDDYDTTFGSSLSHDPAVNAQFIGSCLPHMCLPFNASAIPEDLEPIFTNVMNLFLRTPLLSIR
jgi:hypothetical protein